MYCTVYTEAYAGVCVRTYASVFTKLIFKDKRLRIVLLVLEAFYV